MNENLIGTLSVIALFLSICAVGMLYLQPDEKVDVSGIASNQALISSLVTAINNVENDVSSIKIPSIEVDSDDLEELEDDLNDDINDLEDDIEDLQDGGIQGEQGIQGIQGIQGEQGIDGTCEIMEIECTTTKSSSFPFTYTTECEFVTP